MESIDTIDRGIFYIQLDLPENEFYSNGKIQYSFKKLSRKKGKAEL